MLPVQEITSDLLAALPNAANGQTTCVSDGAGNFKNMAPRPFLKRWLPAACIILGNTARELSRLNTQPGTDFIELQDAKRFSFFSEQEATEQIFFPGSTRISLIQIMQLV